MNKTYVIYSFATIKGEIEITGMVCSSCHKDVNKEDKVCRNCKKKIVRRDQQ